MNGQMVGSQKQSGSPWLQILLPMLLAILAATVFACSPADGAMSMPIRVVVSDNQYTPPSDGKTHEDYNLPQDSWGQAYRQGLRDGYQAQQSEDEINTRTQKLLRTRDEAVKAGLQAFSEGNYGEAVDIFLLATELDHGDPVSRLYAAQSLFALQQYDQALPLLRRAFDLQPHLLYLRFDLRLDYGNPADLAAQITGLQTFMASNPDWSDGYLLLGYELLHSGQRNPAYQAFSRAAQLDPVDTLCRKFLRVSYPVPTRSAPTKPATPAPKATPADPAAPARQLAPTSPAVPATPAAKVTSTSGRKA
jgi:tetratricopeptide (TPR) repeat protein